MGIWLMRLGLDLLLTDQKSLLQGKRLGLLVNQASLDSKGRLILDLLIPEQKAWRVMALFSPEHGLISQAQYMEPVESSIHQPSGLPIYSLYGKSIKSLTPKKYMLDKIDCLLVDLQDVGARYYTYVWTTILCLEECAKRNISVLICDRPNPINGVTMEGELNEKGYTSFVGLYPLPVRHGMTIGELAHFINDVHNLNCNLTVIAMERWERKWFWEETGLKWTNPSPNIRSPLQALLYPGMCLFEATNISEGRGTDIPFEIVGAPFVSSDLLIAALNELNLPGVRFEPTEFKPSAPQKWGEKLCHGVKLHVIDRNTFKPYATGIALLWAIYSLTNECGFQWRSEPYEFVEDLPAIDLLTGTTIVRKAIEKHLPLSEILEWVGEPSETFRRQRNPYLLY